MTLMENAPLTSAALYAPYLYPTWELLVKRQKQGCLLSYFTKNVVNQRNFTKYLMLLT